MKKNKTRRPLFEGWRPIDVCLACLFMALIPIMMIIATVNLQSLIENSYQPVFINAPWKAWMISILAPAASLCIERVSCAFTHKQTKRFYKKALYLLTALVIVTWIVLFSMTFDGFSAPNIGGLADINIIETSAQDTRFYSFVQLVAEILISSCLFIGLETLFDHYQPEKEKPNPEWQSLDEKIHRLKRERSDAIKVLEQETKQHTHLVNAREAFIDCWLNELTITKAQHAAVSKFLGE